MRDMSLLDIMAEPQDFLAYPDLVPAAYPTPERHPKSLEYHKYR